MNVIYARNDFRQSIHLKVHERSHTGETSCKFSQPKHLARDKRKHSGNKSQDNKFRHSSTSLIQTKKTPYQCNICKKKFKEFGRLVSHEKTHAGDKPFECDVCKKTFLTKTSSYFTTKSNICCATIVTKILFIPKICKNIL